MLGFPQRSGSKTLWSIAFRKMVKRLFLLSKISTSSRNGEMSFSSGIQVPARLIWQLLLESGHVRRIGSLEHG
jgi:hypothetical protein